MGDETIKIVEYELNAKTVRRMREHEFCDKYNCYADHPITVDMENLPLFLKEDYRRFNKDWLVREYLVHKDKNNCKNRGEIPWLCLKKFSRSGVVNLCLCCNQCRDSCEGN